jgi:hypothetical protein
MVQRRQGRERDVHVRDREGARARARSKKDGDQEQEQNQEQKLGQQLVWCSRTIESESEGRDESKGESYSV